MTFINVVRCCIYWINVLKMFVQVAKTRCMGFLLCSIKFTMTFLTNSPSLNTHTSARQTQTVHRIRVSKSTKLVSLFFAEDGRGFGISRKYYNQLVKEPSRCGILFRRICYFNWSLIEAFKHTHLNE